MAKQVEMFQPAQLLIVAALLLCTASWLPAQSGTWQPGGHQEGRQSVRLQSGDVDWPSHSPSQQLESLAPTQPGYQNRYRSLPTQDAQNDFLDPPLAPEAAFAPPADAPPPPGGLSREDIAKLMMPTFMVGGEWLAESSDIGLTSFNAGIVAPIYPIFGPPPPMLNFRYTLTRIDSPMALALPDEVHDYTFGVAWVRKVNEQWTWRMMANMAYASDGRNTTSDAWQFRGGFFAMYRPNPEWSWVFGALALGRKDIPAVPAIGATWTPNEALKVDLLMPRPRASLLLADDGARQQWGYLGAGLSGGTWAVERAAIDDQMTYRDWRLVIGWESVPKPPPGVPFARGRRITLEAGFVFSREIEFDAAATTIPLDETVLLRGALHF